MILWFLRLFPQFRKLQDERDRSMWLAAYRINPGHVGSQGELEHDLYCFLAERIPLGMSLMVLPTKESFAMGHGTIAAQLVVPARSK